jgi:hypothetical protein
MASASDPDTKPNTQVEPTSDEANGSGPSLEIDVRPMSCRLAEVSWFANTCPYFTE